MATAKEGPSSLGSEKGVGSRGLVKPQDLEESQELQMVRSHPFLTHHLHGRSQASRVLQLLWRPPGALGAQGQAGGGVFP